MIWLVVGCDGTGKSEFCKRLSCKTGMPVIHMDKPKTEEEKENMFKQYRDLFMEKNDFIMDRSFYCEMVYGPVMRDKSWISIEHMVQLEEILSTKGAFVVHCTDDAERIMARFATTHEDYVTMQDQVEALLMGYKVILAGSSLPVLLYTIPKGGDEIAKFKADHARSLHEICKESE